jgi:hypothetical protein
MKIIEVPEEITARAQKVFYLKDAVNAVIKELINHIALNQVEVSQLWREVEVIAQQQGLTKQDDETYNFDYITNKFIVTKVKGG